MKNLFAEIPKFETPNKSVINPFIPYEVSLPESPDIEPQFSHTLQLPSLKDDQKFKELTIMNKTMMLRGFIQDKKPD